MPKDSRIERFSRWLLVAFYHFARFLGVINCSFDRREMVVRQIKRRSKFAVISLRIIIIIGFVGVLPNAYNKFLDTPDSYLRLFTTLQVVSVSIFAGFSFVIQTRGEASIIAVLNRFIVLFRRIAQKTQAKRLFGGKFLFLLLVKSIATLIGCLNEMPALMQVDHVLDFGGWADVLIGVYLWMGSMFVLDACFLGFLNIAVMYENMGIHLANMLDDMKYIEVEDSGSVDFGVPVPPLSHYKRMKLLCDYADSMDDSAIIYSELYGITKQFHRIFQWQILYYIYYNFMVILLLLHQCIWLYIYSNYIDMIGLFMVAVKIGNLALLIMCADYAIRKSQLPGLLCLDVVCSDIDARWDMSVETFLNQRKSENLEIKVLGFFHLDNSFILLILSAIISYLFILIQFGMTGGFEENEVVKNVAWD